LTPIFTSFEPAGKSTLASVENVTLETEVDMYANARVEAEVLSTVDGFNDAISRKDVDATLSLFAPDPDVFLMGSEADEVATGPDEIRRHLQRIFARPVTYRWDWKSRKVSAAASVAWVAADASVTGAHPYRITVVLEKRDGRWLLMQFHGSEPAQPW